MSAPDEEVGPYPDSARSDVVDDYHGTAVADPYRWLEDPDDKEVREWIAAQNALSSRWVSAVEERDSLRERLRTLWDRPRRSTPTRRGDRWFQLRNSGLQDQDVLWASTSLADDASEWVLVDPNELSVDGTVALAAAAASRDGRLLAYALSEAGSDWMTWRVRDVETGADHPDVVCWSKFAGAAWLPDASGFFYAGYPAPEEGDELRAAHHGHRLWLHRLDTDQADDLLIHHEPDEPEWLFAPTVTHDGRYLLLTVSHGTRRENAVLAVDLAPLAAGDAGALSVRPVFDAFDASYEVVGSDGDTLYVRTDAGAERGRLVAVDLADPDPARWVELIAEHPTDLLEQVVLAGSDAATGGPGRFVVAWLHHAHHRLERFTLDGTPDGGIALDDLGAIEALAGRPDDDGVSFSFVTFTRPPTLYRHELASSDTRLLHAPEIPVDADLRTEQVFARSRDGTQVPVFLVHRADVTPPPQGRPCSAGEGHPTLLWGYGGFGISVTPMFRTWWLAWIERGGVLAVAVLRGGGEYGTAWQEAGKREHKQNVFDDGLAAAEWLIDNGWTHPERLAITGGSNGGLLVGACITQRPDLFGAAVVEVGVLDLLRFHRFTIGWAWTSDYGLPDDPEQFRWLYAYSPLHHIRPGVRYPATLITTGDHDDRVVPAHSFKFAAALQAAQATIGDAPPVLLRVETDTGHGAGKPTRVAIDERADVLAFLLRALDALR